MVRIFATLSLVRFMPSWPWMSYLISPTRQMSQNTIPLSSQLTPNIYITFQYNMSTTLICIHLATTQTEHS